MPQANAPRLRRSFARKHSTLSQIPCIFLLAKICWQLRLALTNARTRLALQVGLVRRDEVGAGQKGAVAVARLDDDIALFAEFGEVVAYQGLHFLRVDGVADVRFHFVHGLQFRLEVIFDLQDFESGASLDHVADLAFAHWENNRFDLWRELSPFEGTQTATVFCGATLGIKPCDLAAIIAVEDAGAQALLFAAHGSKFFRAFSFSR